VKLGFTTWLAPAVPDPFNGDASVLHGSCLALEEGGGTLDFLGFGLESETIPLLASYDLSTARVSY